MKFRVTITFEYETDKSFYPDGISPADFDRKEFLEDPKLIASVLDDVFYDVHIEIVSKN